MKKLFVIFLSLFILIPKICAVSNVDYEVNDYIIDASIDISGNITVKEVIGVKGTFNGYIRDLKYKNSLNSGSFTGTKEDFEGSPIYDATGIEVTKVGTVNYNKELDFDVFDKDVNVSSECSYSKGCYQKSDYSDMVSLKMYNETSNGTTYFYIEYILLNAVVVHEDVAEVYYNFIGSDFDDDILKLKLRLNLPIETTEQIRVWAHGPLTGEVKFVTSKENNKTIYHGGYLSVNNLNRNTPVDIRMTFPKDLIIVEHPGLKKSNVSALDKIIEVETERADNANRQRSIARIKVYGTYIFSFIYILFTIGLIIYIYFKYDKEYKSSFNNEYNREFIDEYDVTLIEYLFDKNITEKAFSTSILNLIYKKKIKYEQTDKNKYLFTKVSEEGLLDAEKELMKIIFDNAGDGKKVTLEQIKKYASSLKGTTSPFLNSYNNWKNIVTTDAVNQNFYENNSAKKLYFGLYAIIGFILLFMYFNIGIFNILTFLVIFATIVYLIYLFTFNKRTVRGNDHFVRWSAFKKFLEDFGRFNEKELPDITLWERYLVYANIFGIASKVSNTMKVKFNELNYSESDTDIFFDYMLWNHLNHSINNAVNNSISTAKSKVAAATAAEISRSSNSSGGGFGGGFSSGGGFGGGGGGGRGF